jgi:hypothetical protein
MTPVWKITSGEFAGWYSSDALYNSRGIHIGCLAGASAYSLAGEYLGDIHEAQWIGRPDGVHRNHAPALVKAENVAHAPLPDREGLALPGWVDPAF